ncbi:MAG TPA: MASE1 domain-containing protein [Candidatus Limnocylindrales bacterium]|nr:MASE1 domain-containing protein [Candidatus Limnocylindrales bacterium]
MAARSAHWRPLMLRTALAWPERLQALSGPAVFAFVAAVYLALAQFVYWLNDPVETATGFWPAAGFSLALLLVLPQPRWPWALAGVAVAEFLGDLVHGYPVGAVVLWGAGDVVEPLVGAVLIRTFSPMSIRLAPLNSLVGFVLFGVVVAPLVGGPIGSLGTVLFTGMPAADVFPKYVTGDALGILVAAPVLLTWADRSARRERRPEAVIEAVLLLLSSSLVTILVFTDPTAPWEVTLPYLVVPFLAWAALRFGLRGVALIGFVVANIANWFTATGHGPFAMTAGGDLAVTLLQVFLGITLISSLALASLGTDLVDSKEMARREAEHYAEVQRSREFRDAFLGVLGHEIRTPITTLYGMVELFRSHRVSTESEVLDRYFDDLGSEVDRLRRLTEDLLVLSRADANRLDVVSEPVALRPFTTAVVERERRASPRHRILVEAPASIPPVLGGDGYIEQVLRNYLGNATKYSPPDSTIRVLLEAEDGGVAVRVEDEGPGLTPDSAARVFDLFYRAPEAVASAGGAGIGLFVCRKLIEAMHGRVWAASLASGGAEFGFWLPAVSEDDGPDG